MEQMENNRLFSAAKKICTLGNWEVTNLQLQKIIYFTQMFFLAKESGLHLADGEFEAWSYGPVHPELYEKVKIFGASPIQNVFHAYDESIFKEEELETINGVWDSLKDKTAGELVRITHAKIGAWSKHYESGRYNVPIPNQSILDEYYERTKST